MKKLLVGALMALLMVGCAPVKPTYTLSRDSSNYVLSVKSGKTERKLTSPIVVNNALFYNTPSGLRGSWNFFGDGSTESDRNAYLAYAQKHVGVNTLVWNLFNEGQMSAFLPHQYMGALDNARCDLILRWVQTVSGAGGQVIPTFFDGPPLPGEKYFPILNQWDKHEAMIKLACNALNPYSKAYIVGIEVSRYYSASQVEQLISWIKQYSDGRPVGIHDAWKPSWGWPANCDFLAYELSWNPHDGGSHSAAECVAEVKDRQSHLPPGFAFWPMEWNLDNESALCKDQARAMAALPGVVGIGEPLTMFKISRIAR